MTNTILVSHTVGITVAAGSTATLEESSRNGRKRRSRYSMKATRMPALTGSVVYGAVALAERRVTFWHPSQRK